MIKWLISVCEKGIKEKHCTMCKHYKINNSPEGYGFCNKYKVYNPFCWDETKPIRTWCEGKGWSPGGGGFDLYKKIKR